MIKQNFAGVIARSLKVYYALIQRKPIYKMLLHVLTCISKDKVPSIVWVHVIALADFLIKKYAQTPLNLTMTMRAIFLAFKALILGVTDPSISVMDPFEFFSQRYGMTKKAERPTGSVKIFFDSKVWTESQYARIESFVYNSLPYLFANRIFCDFPNPSVLLPVVAISVFRLSVLDESERRIESLRAFMCEALMEMFNPMLAPLDPCVKIRLVMTAMMPSRSREEIESGLSGLGLLGAQWMMAMPDQMGRGYCEVVDLFREVVSRHGVFVMQSAERVEDNEDTQDIEEQSIEDQMTRLSMTPSSEEST